MPGSGMADAGDFESLTYVGSNPTRAVISLLLTQELAMSRETESCVICQADTKVPRSIDVRYRLFYVEGVGQLCKYCWRATYENRQPSYSK